MGKGFARSAHDKEASRWTCLLLVEGGFCANFLQRSTPAFSCVVVREREPELCLGGFQTGAFRAKMYLTLGLNVEMFDWNSMAGIPKKVGGK